MVLWVEATGFLGDVTRKIILIKKLSVLPYIWKISKVSLETCRSLAIIESPQQGAAGDLSFSLHERGDMMKRYEALVIGCGSVDVIIVKPLSAGRYDVRYVVDGVQYRDTFNAGDSIRVCDTILEFGVGEIRHNADEYTVITALPDDYDNVTISDYSPHFEGSINPYLKKIVHNTGRVFHRIDSRITIIIKTRLMPTILIRKRR